MAIKHLKREPHNLDDHAWWYEEPAGITVVMEAYNARGYGSTEMRTLSWASLRAALTRRDRGERSKRTAVGKSEVQK